jgi:cytochrome c-type biogenesis protein CcsB
MRSAWRAEDARMVNAQVVKLAELLPTVAPDIYPATGRLAMESWYFRYNSMTWIWLMYLAAIIPLLMSTIYGWDRARLIGILLFIVAFAFQSASLIIRWYISGRWPNANMFEAVTTAAWFGGAGTLIMEWLLRKTPLRNLTALGSAVMSMAALMAAYFLPAHLDPSISNKMAALNDVWLYIHTNVIIWSYAVIGIACIPALLLLRHRWCQLWDSGVIPKVRLLMLPIALGVMNYTGYLLLMHLIDNANRGLGGGTLLGVSGAFWGSLMLVILEAFEARSRRQAGIRVDRGASGGASSIILGNPSATGFLRPDKPTPTQIYDGATMVLVEVAFIMLWAGTVMGAIWADHSWGRPWGWDPKETFALNTFLIFLVLIHVRLKVKDKAFWTAILAVIGFEVMMFNWIVVNFVISGLHSYA